MISILNLQIFILKTVFSTIILIYLACGEELNCRLGDSFVKWSVDGQCYKFIDTTVLFSQANSTCQSYGGYPTSVKSVEQENFLFAMMSAEAVGTIWIGLYRGSDGQYYWYEDNSHKGSYGEAPSGQFCFTGISRSTSGTNWFFKNCNSQTTAKIICVMPPTCPQDSTATECVAPTTPAPETTTAEEDVPSLTTTKQNAHTLSNQPSGSVFSELSTSTMESPSSKFIDKTAADDGTTEMIAKAATFESFYTESTTDGNTASSLKKILFSTTTQKFYTASMDTAPAANEHASSSTSSNDVELASASTDSHTSPILHLLSDATSTASDLFTTRIHELTKTLAVDDSTSQTDSTNLAFKPGVETTSTTENADQTLSVSSFISITDSFSNTTNTEPSTTSIGEKTTQDHTTGENVSLADSVELGSTVRTDLVSTSVESTSQADGTQQPASTDSERTSTSESLGLSSVVSSTSSVDMKSHQTQHTSASSRVTPSTSRLTLESKVTSDLDSAMSSNYNPAITTLDPGTTVKVESVTLSIATTVLNNGSAEKQMADVGVRAGSAAAALVGAAAIIGVAAFMLKKKPPHNLSMEEVESFHNEEKSLRQPERNPDTNHHRDQVLTPTDVKPELPGGVATKPAVRTIRVAPAPTW